MFKEFQNLKLEHLETFKELNLIVAFGYRTCIILDDNLEMLCKFLDSNKNERYYCATIFENQMENFCSKNSYFIAIAGESGVIKILDIQEGTFLTYLTGHTGAICNIKNFNNFLISCSEDSSIRIWDLNTLKCVGVCGGIFGHKDHILSIDILFNKSLIVSSGTDCAIKQWKIDEIKPYKFIYEPFTSFNNVHRCPINKVMYYGNMIVSLSNNNISIIYNNINKPDDTFNLNRNDPILIGNIDLFNNCKSFEIIGHILIGMGTTGDIYIFDLRNLINENKPFIMSTNVESADDFTFNNGFIYISSGNKIYKIQLDLDHFNDKYRF